MPGHGRRRRRRLVTQGTEPRFVGLRECPCELQRSSANAPTGLERVLRARFPLGVRVALGLAASVRFAWLPVPASLSLRLGEEVACRLGTDQDERWSPASRRIERRSRSRGCYSDTADGRA